MSLSHRPFSMDTLLTDSSACATRSGKDLARGAPGGAPSRRCARERGEAPPRSSAVHGSQRDPRRRRAPRDPRQRRRVASGPHRARIARQTRSRTAAARQCVRKPGPRRGLIGEGRSADQALEPCSRPIGRMNGRFAEAGRRCPGVAAASRRRSARWVVPTRVP